MTSTFSVEPHGGISACTPINGWSNIIVPGKNFFWFVVDDFSYAF